MTAVADVNAVPAIEGSPACPAPGSAACVEIDEHCPEAEEVAVWPDLEEEESPQASKPELDEDPLVLNPGLFVSRSLAIRVGTALRRTQTPGESLKSSLKEQGRHARPGVTWREEVVEQAQEPPGYSSEEVSESSRSSGPREDASPRLQWPTRGEVLERWWSHNPTSWNSWGSWDQSGSNSSWSWTPEEDVWKTNWWTVVDDSQWSWSSWDRRPEESKTWWSKPSGTSSGVSNHIEDIDWDDPETMRKCGWRTFRGEEPENEWKSRPGRSTEVWEARRARPAIWCSGRLMASQDRGGYSSGRDSDSDSSSRAGKGRQIARPRRLWSSGVRSAEKVKTDCDSDKDGDGKQRWPGAEEQSDGTGGTGGRDD